MGLLHLLGFVSLFECQALKQFPGTQTILGTCSPLMLIRLYILLIPFYNVYIMLTQLNKEVEYVVIQNRVKELRARFNYSQSDLAGLAGVTRQTIAALEKGDYVPSLLLGLAICKAVNLPMEEVFWLDDDKEETK